MTTTLTFYSQTTDDEVGCVAPAGQYAKVQDGTGTKYLRSSSTPDQMVCGQYWDGVNFNNMEPFFEFDTSSIPDDAIITSVDLWLYCISPGGTSHTIEIRTLDWGAAVDTGDYVIKNNISGTIIASLSGPSTIGQKAFTVTQSAFIPVINKTGITKLYGVSSRYRNGNQPAGSEYTTFYTSNRSNTDEKPTLRVTYKLPYVNSRANRGGNVAKFSGALLTSSTPGDDTQFFLNGANNGPDSISGLQAWYDWTNLDISDDANANYITQDLSNNGKYAYRNLRMVYDDRVINGMGATRPTDTYSANSYSSWMGSALTLPQPFSFFYVFRTSPNLNDYIMLGNNADGKVGYSGAAFYIARPGQTTVQTTGITPQPNTWYVAVYSIASGTNNAKIYVNSTTASGVGTTNIAWQYGGTTDSSLLGWAGLDSKYAEFAAWNVAVTAPQVSNLMAYCNAKYGFNIT